MGYEGSWVIRVRGITNIRKSGEIRFSNMKFMNAQTTSYNCVSATCRIMVASSTRYTIISAIQNKYDMTKTL